jgi:DNA topoisomerase-1
MPGTRRRKKIQPELITDPQEAAEAANLRYVNDGEPGIRREQEGDEFVYYDADGKRVKDEATLERIRALGIPPAYTEVWICATHDGHLQATGRDAKGRKQYRYHSRWAEIRGQTKFDRMILFAEALPRIREQVEQHLALPGMPREKVLALVVKLLGTTFIRVGNAEYARDNDSFGLTTMHDEHVSVEGSKIHFSFRGKSGKDHEIDVRDKRVAKLVQRSQDLPGQALFQYRDADGNPHPITSTDVNAYLKEISGQPFTAKDFRTWGGTTLAVLALAETQFETDTERKKHVTDMVKQVSAQLGNTVSVCRKYYIHPAVLDAYQAGTLRGLLEEAAPLAGDKYGLEPCEQAVLALLRERLAAAA